MSKFNQLVMQLLPSIIMMILGGVCAGIWMMVRVYFTMQHIESDIAQIVVNSTELADRGVWMGRSNEIHNRQDREIAACFDRIIRIEDRVFVN